MPTIIFTVGEMAEAAIMEARKQTARVLELADLSVTPLNPGESVATRHHEIAKAGKKLAEAFLAFDKLMQSVADASAAHGDVTAQSPVEPDKETN